MHSIVFNNVSKIYKKGPKVIPGLRDWVEFFTYQKFFLRKESFYAIRDLSFSIDRGSVVGFIGPNGAGKSTILKLISKVTEPSDGEISTQGKIAGLLELGAGFHTELTGRENIFFKSAILGMKKQQIEDRFDDIAAFSELEEFLDTPIKYYSSGMYARLGFSVAIHINPDILLIDEVLSVGDASFRDKCIEKVEDFSTSEKKAVVFVSHNLEYVKKLCKKVFWIDKGQIIKFGEPEKVIGDYLDSVEKEKKSKRL